MSRLTTALKSLFALNGRRHRRQGQKAEMTSAEDSVPVAKKNPLAMPAATPFTYKTLDTTIDEIRLAVLLPADDISVLVEIELIHIILKDPPAMTVEAQTTEYMTKQGERSTYSALSYVWGDDKITRPIRVNGVLVNVTANLESALRHIRRSNQEISIWADAICINQNDLLERNSQVRKMKRIYECAFGVIIWLGEEIQSSTALAVDFLRQHVNFDFEAFQQMALFDRLAGQDDLQKVMNHLVETKNSPKFSSAWEAIGQDLLKRPWWNRIWVIQEIACSRRAIVFCGRHQFSWNDLVAAVTFARNHSLRIFHRTPEELATTNGFHANAIFYSNYRQNRVRGTPMLLHELLLNNIGCSSKRPEDMIFALYGLATDVDDAPELVPDYSKSVKEVYTDFVKFHICTYHTLDILCMNMPSKQHQDLPSWVPDWSNAKKYSTYCFAGLATDFCKDGRYVYRASGDSLPLAVISDGNDKLSVSGALVDTIIRIGSLAPTSAEFMKVIESWLYLAIGSPQGGKRPYIRGGTVIDAVNRTITTDRTLSGHRAPPGHRGFDCDVTTIPHDYREGMGLSREEKEKFWAEDAFKMISLVAAGRRLFVTQEGCFGLGPRNMEVGDGVYVLKGCSVPMILRKEGPEYTLVGESFITGIMDGEAMEDIRQGKYEMQTFVIR